MNAPNILEAKAKTYPDKAAFIFRDESITFSSLKDKVFRLANAFIQLERFEIKRHDRIAIYLPSRPEHVYSYLATWACGATAVPLDYMLTEDELAACLNHCEAKVLIARPKESLDLLALKKRCPQLKEIVISSDILSVERDNRLFYLDDLIEESQPQAPKVTIANKDYAIIFYTSGTTGKPKGVLVNYLQLGVPPSAMEYFVDFTDKDILLCALPFSHLGGLIYILNCLSFGMTVVLMERFIPLEFLKNIQQYKVTCFWVVPSMYYALLHLKEFEKFDLSSLRWMVTFGASSSPEALRRFNQYCPQAHVLNGWGMTETNAPTTVLPMGSKKIESVGRPAPFAEIQIVNDEDCLVKRGQIGEIVVRGWMVTDGYYKDPEMTKEVIRNGWFYTGDLGRIDEEGDLFIVGRKKEMIKVAGEIVFEPEVEAAIQAHPCVAEVAVIGVADALRGEVPKALIVLKEQHPLTEQELRDYLRQHLAHYKIPHYFEFRQALPKNRSFKIDKESLRKDSSPGNNHEEH